MKMELHDIEVCADKAVRRRLEISISVKVTIKHVQKIIKQQNTGESIENRGADGTALNGGDIDDVTDKILIWPRKDIDINKDNESISSATTKESKMADNIKNLGINIEDTIKVIHTNVADNGTKDQRRSKEPVAIEESADIDKIKKSTIQLKISNIKIKNDSNRILETTQLEHNINTVDEGSELLPQTTINDITKEDRDWTSHEIKNVNIIEEDRNKDLEVSGKRATDNKESEQDIVIDVENKITDMLEERPKMEIHKENELLSLSTATSKDKKHHFETILPFCKITNINMASKDTNEAIDDNLASNERSEHKDVVLFALATAEDVSKDGKDDLEIELAKHKITNSEIIEQDSIKVLGSNVSSNKASYDKESWKHIAMDAEGTEMNKSSRKVLQNIPNIEVGKEIEDMLKGPQDGSKINIGIPDKNELLSLSTDEANKLTDNLDRALHSNDITNESGIKEDINEPADSNVPSDEATYDKGSWQHIAIEAEGTEMHNGSGNILQNTPNVEVEKEVGDMLKGPQDGSKINIGIPDKNELLSLSTDEEEANESTDNLDRALHSKEITNESGIKEGINEPADSNVLFDEPTYDKGSWQHIAIEAEGTKMDKSRSKVLQNTPNVEVEKEVEDMLKGPQDGSKINIGIPDKNELLSLSTDEADKLTDNLDRALHSNEITNESGIKEGINEPADSNVPSDEATYDKGSWQHIGIEADGTKMDKSSSKVLQNTPNVEVEKEVGDMLKGPQDGLKIDIGIPDKNELLSLSTDEEEANESTDNLDRALHSNEITNESGIKEDINELADSNVPSDEPTYDKRSWQHIAIEAEGTEMHNGSGNILQNTPNVEVEKEVGDMLKGTQDGLKIDIGIPDKNELLSLSTDEANKLTDNLDRALHSNEITNESGIKEDINELADSNVPSDEATYDKGSWQHIAIEAEGTKMDKSSSKVLQNTPNVEVEKEVGDKLKGPQDGLKIDIGIPDKNELLSLSTDEEEANESTDNLDRALHSNEITNESGIKEDINELADSNVPSDEPTYDKGSWQHIAIEAEGTEMHNGSGNILQNTTNVEVEKEVEDMLKGPQDGSKIDIGIPDKNELLSLSTGEANKLTDNLDRALHSNEITNESGIKEGINEPADSNVPSDEATYDKGSWQHIAIEADGTKMDKSSSKVLQNTPNVEVEKEVEDMLKGPQDGSKIDIGIPDKNELLSLSTDEANKLIDNLDRALHSNEITNESGIKEGINEPADSNVPSDEATYDKGSWQHIAIEAKGTKMDKSSSKVLQNTPNVEVEKEVGDMLKGPQDGLKIDIGIPDKNELLSLSTDEEEANESTDNLDRALHSNEITNESGIKEDINELADSNVPSDEATYDKGSWQHIAIEAEGTEMHNGSGNILQNTPNVEVEKDVEDMLKGPQDGSKIDIGIPDKNELLSLSTDEANKLTDNLDRALHSNEITNESGIKEGINEPADSNVPSDEATYDKGSWQHIAIEAEGTKMDKSSSKVLQNTPNVEVEKEVEDMLKGPQDGSKIDIGIPDKNELLSLSTDEANKLIDNLDRALHSNEITNESGIKEDINELADSNVPSDEATYDKGSWQHIAIEAEGTKMDKSSSKVLQNTPNVEVEKEVGDMLKGPQDGLKIDIGIPDKNELLSLSTDEEEANESTDNLDRALHSNEITNESGIKEDINELADSNVPSDEATYDKGSWQHIAIEAEGTEMHNGSGNILQNTPNVEIEKEVGDMLKGPQEGLKIDIDIADKNELLSLSTDENKANESTDNLDIALHSNEITNQILINENINEVVDNNVPSNEASYDKGSWQHIAIDEDGIGLEENNNTIILQNLPDVDILEECIDMLKEEQDEQEEQDESMIDIGIPEDNELSVTINEHPTNVNTDNLDRTLHSHEVTNICSIKEDANEFVDSNMSSNEPSDNKDSKQYTVGEDDCVNMVEIETSAIYPMNSSVDIWRNDIHMTEIAQLESKEDIGNPKEIVLLLHPTTEDASEEDSNNFKRMLPTCKITCLDNGKIDKDMFKGSPLEHNIGYNKDNELILRTTTKDKTEDKTLPSTNVCLIKEDILQCLEAGKIRNTTIPTKVRSINNSSLQLMPEVYIDVDKDNKLATTTEEASEEDKNKLERILPVCKITKIKRGKVDSNIVPNSSRDHETIIDDEYSVLDIGVKDNVLSTSEDVNEVDASYLEATLHLCKVRRNHTTDCHVSLVNENEQFAKLPLKFTWESDRI